ncbi:hypothetical protein [Streptomyces sp. H39-S7]|uniref:hypothetical protein n=1 Tax=Streptomyces sp. H39-S7 TaxID=3004357 RepID=UPI003FA71161
MGGGEVGEYQGTFVVLVALDADDTPLRLALGGDAVDALTGHMDAVRAELTAWEKVSRATGFDSQ